MTTENRRGLHIPLAEKQSAELHLQHISYARQRGEELIAAGKTPQVVSTAVHECLLHHFNDSLIHRRMESPYDVTLTVDGETHLVFFDYDCHLILLEVARYLSRYSLETTSWNQN